MTAGDDSVEVNSVEVSRGALAGRVAVVTGAGAGIGREVALALSRAGACVVVNDVSDGAAQGVVGEIEKEGGHAASCVVPIGGADAALALVAVAREAFGGFDILVNNAGVTRDRMIHNMSEEEFDDVIRVHLKGTWCNCREAVRVWRPEARSEAEAESDPALRRHRKIINVSSVSGLRGNVGQTNYAAAKAGIVGLTKALAKEVGPLAINVNAVAPVARTAMTRGNDLGLHVAEGQARDAYLQARLQRSALRWIGEVDAVSPAFVFLASAASDYLTGQVLNVDGGANI